VRQSSSGFLQGCRCLDDLLVIPSEVEGSRDESEKLAMRHQNYFVYIPTNQRHKVLSIGITNDLGRRLWEHGASRRSRFARQYNADKLIHFEAFPDPRSAIAREKQLKRWRRSKREALIAKSNPDWRDLITEMWAVK
jgi:putative endonuclease